MIYMAGKRESDGSLQPIILCNPEDSGCIFETEHGFFLKPGEWMAFPQRLPSGIVWVEWRLCELPTAPESHPATASSPP